MPKKGKKAKRGKQHLRSTFPSDPRLKIPLNGAPHTPVNGRAIFEELNDKYGGTAQLLYFLPFAVGMVGGGLGRPEPNRYLEVGVVVSLFALTRLFFKLSSRHLEKTIFVLRAAIVFAIIVFAAVYLSASGDLNGAAILLAAVITYAVILQLRSQSAREILVFSLASIFFMSLLSLLGVIVQVPQTFPLRALILGLIPASELVAVVTATYASVYERAGWRRTREAIGIDKVSDGKKPRPGYLTLLVLVSSLLIPATVVFLTPLGFVPYPFLFLIVPLYFVPQFAQAFFERTRADAAIAQGLFRIAALTGGIMLLIAVLIR